MLFFLRCSLVCFFFSSRRRHTRFDCDWSSDVCSSDLDFADRRVGGGRNLHQIKPAFPRELHCLERLHDTELRTLFVNHPDFARPDAFVYARTVTRPEVAFSDKSPSRAIGTCFPRIDQELAPKCTNTGPRKRRYRGRVPKYSMAEALR